MSGEPTADLVADDELLTRLFSGRDWQDGKISSAVFKSDEISVFRAAYLDLESTIERHGPSDGAAQITAAFARADSAKNVDVVKDEDGQPYAHAHIVLTVKLPDGSRKCNSTGQAKRLRAEAMLNIRRMPLGM